MNITRSASAASAIPWTGSDLHTTEGFQLALARGLDKVWKRTFQHVQQGMKYFREEKLTRETASFRTWRMMDGLVNVNRDEEDIPYGHRGEGFGFSVQTYNYRKGVAYSKTLVETDDVGVIRGLQSDLSRNADLTVELAMADVFNRACNPSNAPILCDDGMYLIDSSRPNANPAAAAWGNEETASAITPSSIYQAQLNARATRDENGELAPAQVRGIICRPTDEQTLWTIQKSDYRPTDATNAKNFEFGKFEYEVYDFLTDAAIFYKLGNPKGDDNELQFYWRVRPEFKTWVDGSNPDITRQRVRFAFGIGCGSPRKMWRGGEVS